MKIVKTNIEDVVIIESKVFGDATDICVINKF